MGITRNPSFATTTTFLLLPLFLFLLSQPVSSRRGSIVGGWSEVKGVRNNKEIQELGRFSVKQYNRMHRSSGDDQSSGGGGDDGLLLFSEVVEAKRQVVAGFKYKLRIEAVRHGVSQMFESVVVVVPWRNNSRELVGFGPYKVENNNDIKIVGF